MTKSNHDQCSDYIAQTNLPTPIEESFAYHDRPGALQRLVPPWESVELEHSDNSLAVGSRVVMKTKVMGVPLRWVAEHTEYDPPNLFADTQVSGPFASWDHRHEFFKSDSDAGGSQLRDHIRYRLPMGQLGRIFGSGKARKTIEAMFAYRHRITRDDLQLSTDHPIEAMRVAVSGSSGMVGSSMSSLLTLLGHRVHPIVRSPDQDESSIAAWSSPEEAAKFDGVDAVIHLAGKSIASARWTDQIKSEIRDSRVIKTRQLCESLASLDNKPKVLICASATGIYGDRGEEVLNEDSAPHDDFLAEVAKEWEAACQPAIEAGIRVVNARFGIILSPSGGALQKTLTPAKLMGGALGNGKQWWSWMALDDVVGALYHAMATESVSGPVNFVAPASVRNRDFAKTLGRVLGRPALFPAPAFALRLALGEMADDLLLSSTRVEPAKLIQSGYQFRFTDLESFFQYSLGRNRLKSVQL
ncbi:Epimerase family protein [Rubripirellula obstinata]|uniref:Epimerase family protein n=1 Tax=Rubripirellula obstinata TaxID=406547 RepID=A0A5B1CHL2_9BACT|nr:TIGR01777 family oxidoreductase [Rubripirellula obstinata]KAA1258714.1 Epimerase family protein [Rubripirellula obstinata]